LLALQGPENPRQADGPEPPTAERRADTHGFAGERRELFESVAAPDAAAFDDLVEAGSIAGENGRQTRYFETEAHPGDGVLVTEFVIQEESSGPLAGDGRPLTDDPLGEELPLDDSRVVVVLDRETGRGVVTVSSSETSVNIVPRVTPVLDNPGGVPFDVRLEPAHADARPIEFDGRDLTDIVPNNYFEIDASADNVRIDYDVINPLTAPTQVISVDGPIVLERGANGRFEVGEGHSPDLYPAVAVTQYLPDGTRHTPYFETGKNVYEGATPGAVSEVFEGGREIGEEIGEGWREVGEAEGPIDKTLEVGEAVGETAWEVGEAGVEVGREVLEGLWNMRPWR